MPEVDTRQWSHFEELMSTLPLRRVFLAVRLFRQIASSLAPHITETPQHSSRHHTVRARRRAGMV